MVKSLRTLMLPISGILAVTQILIVLDNLCLDVLAMQGDIRTHGVPLSSPSGQGLGSTARLPCFAPWHSSLLGQSETSSFIYALSALILQNSSFITDFFRNFAANYRYAGVSPAAAAGETPAYQCKAMK